MPIEVETSYFVLRTSKHSACCLAPKVSSGTIYGTVHRMPGLAGTFPTDHLRQYGTNSRWHVAARGVCFRFSQEPGVYCAVDGYLRLSLLSPTRWMSYPTILRYQSPSYSKSCVLERFLRLTSHHLPRSPWVFMPRTPLASELVWLVPPSVL
ncbi:hypothetical protein BC629DRAFT_1510128 [Irpex lacteus]|nr:hypothetical protein BC629DRAFT_1510128 [Irpex lacteus]